MIAPRWTAPPTPKASSSGSRLDAFFGLVRALRADVQDLQRSLQDLEAADTGSKGFTDFYSTVMEVRGHDGGEVDSKLDSLKSLLADDSSLSSYAADEVEDVRNLWNRIATAWPLAGDSDKLLKQLPVLRKLCDELVYDAGLMTIPARVNEHLATCRVGQTVDFSAQFSDELPDPAERQEMLEYLAAHPRSVGGIVDTQTGFIYRSSQHGWRRALSFLLVATTIAIGALVFGLVLPSASWIPGFPTLDGGALLAAYAYALAGSVAHLAIDATKRIRSSQSSPDLAIDTWIIWVHVRELYVSAGIVLVAVAAFGVIAAVHRTDPLTMFLAGYSWDSLQEVFVPRFVKAVNTRTSDLLKQVGN